ncbi:glycosyl transferase [Gloeomargarita lithophora Alchichica-D10]|uniref:Glycosyl transferase n=1 Tax=Gloeomargarita lithophora Alchichica-D10 TaxID=1188229 RepID=A0A1J0AAW2_9CYAN|nr:glycosyltransferase family 39 protein [Gloeomargarita lithophora]APB33076.1 glycosyl transferase [Gloeomargarita lithophora Alchichica-D10]
MVAPSSVSWRWLLGLTGLALVVWLVGLDNVPLRDVDEGQVVLVSRDIFCTGNWLFPTRMGEPYLNKPPLVHWLTALSYHFGGITDWQSRFPAALISALAVPGMYLLGRQVFGKEIPARWSALVFLTLMPVVRHGRLVMLDGTVLTGLVFLLIATAHTRHQPRWSWGMGFMLGILALTKGLIAVPLGLIALAFLAWEQPRIFQKLAFWVGLLLGMVPSLSWFVAQIFHYGQTFFQGHLLDQSLARTWEVVGGEPGLPWYYLEHLLVHSWPWFLFWPGGLLFAWRKRQEAWAKLSLLGTGIFLAIISLMTTKIPWYVMPVYPFFALTVGAKLTQIWQNKTDSPHWWVYLFGFLTLGATGAGIYYGLILGQFDLLGVLLILGITLGGTTVYLWQKKRQFLVMLTGGFYLALVAFMATPHWNWELNNSEFVVKPVAALIRQFVPPEYEVYLSRHHSRRTLDFYSGRRVEAHGKEKLATLWQERPVRPFLLLKNPELDQVNLPKHQVYGQTERYTLVGPPLVPQPTGKEPACPLPKL